MPDSESGMLSPPFFESARAELEALRLERAHVAAYLAELDAVLADAEMAIYGDEGADGEERS